MKPSQNFPFFAMILGYWFFLMQFFCPLTASGQDSANTFLLISRQDQASTRERGASNPSESLDNKAIYDLIDQLRSANYNQRVIASRQLTAIGPKVIPLLFNAIRSSDLETSFRAINIVKRVGLNGDLDTLELIIVQSQELPGNFRDQFDAWSSKAVSQWKNNQSRIAIENLRGKGASVNEIDNLGNLGLMMVDELERKVKPLQEKSSNGIDSVLSEIRDLKRELAGEIVVRNKRQEKEVPRENEFEIRGRKVVVGRGRLLVPPSVNPQLNPRNVVFGSEWKGDARDLNHLRFVVNLNQVEFVEREITGEILDELKKIGQLRELLLTRCKFSFVDLRNFKLEIEKQHAFRLMATGAGYLGVYGPNPGEPDDGRGSYVSLVSPGSAASEAGLERGDLIIQVDNDPVKSFAELSLVISSKPVGQEVKISVMRDQEEKVLTAKLKSRVGLR